MVRVYKAALSPLTGYVQFQGGYRQVKCAVIIASANRARSLHETVCSCLSQTRPPDELLISVHDLAECSMETRALPTVRVVTGAKGLTCQRNTGLKSLRTETEIVLFLDDDIELRSDYIENCLEFMADNLDVVAMSGHIVADGSLGDAAIPRHVARTLIRSREIDDRSVRERRGLYGCNMVVRADTGKDLLFDERLKLYALFEDIDFGIRCTRRGKVVSYRGCVAVHLAERSGRLAHKRFGFAQVMNPYYLWKKGSFSHKDAATLLGSGFLGNMKGLIIPYKGRTRADRFRQLSGNFAALTTILTSGAIPERIEQIQ